MEWSLEDKIHKLRDILAKDGLLNKKQVDDADRRRIAERGRSKIGLSKSFCYNSLDKGPDGIYLMSRQDGKRVLVILYDKGSKPIQRQKFEGEMIKGDPREALLCPYGHTNASVLRETFPSTRPRLLGRVPTFGMGYRPSWGWGNVAQALVAKELGLNVILAQQSAREVERTGRTFQDVVDRATWSAFEAHLTLPWGADGDHLKTESHVRQAVAAGCTYFTYDPSDEIQDRVKGVKVEELKGNDLEEAFREAVPDETTRNRLYKLYQGRPFKIPGYKGKEFLVYEFRPEEVMRIAVKYYQALKKVAELYRLTKELKRALPFETEVSIDETETETTLLAQIFISLELRKMEVEFIGLAPRFSGYFEKAIDYYQDIKSGHKITDIKNFESRLKEIVALAGYFHYKVSVHSGSDKFLIYPVLAEIAPGLLHLKTAGTSYVEEMKIVARHAPDLFREIYAFARTKFREERATYELNTNLNNIPDLSNLNGEEIAVLLESGSGNDDLRQVIHVTYGSVLTAKRKDGSSLFSERCARILKENEEEHFAMLSRHMKRHIQALGLENRPGERGSNG